jgi:ribosomal protein L18
MSEQLKKAKFSMAVLDRGPYAYKGNVKAFTDALRENGITI